MKISHKLVGSFLGVSLLTGAVGAIATWQSQKLTEILTIQEAEHVAQTLEIAVAEHQRHGKNDLQGLIAQLHDLQKRDIEVVDRQKRILADAVPEDIGTISEHDKGNEIQQTMQDGLTRTFLERSDDYPQGIKLIVVPLRLSPNQIDGAVIVEWSSLYNEASLTARPTFLIIGLASLGSIVLAVFIGFQVAHSIARPLQVVTDVAQQVTQTDNFDLQAIVTTTDETSLLATALNDLIQRIKTLLHEKEQHTTELRQTLSQLQATQLQLVQTEKMSSLGQLVAGVAHEINNPVNFIHGNLIHVESYLQELMRVVQAYQNHFPNPPQTLQAILDDADLDFFYEDVGKISESMKVGTERIRQIVLSLRNFSRLDEAEFKAVDLHEGIDNTLLILQHRLKAKPGSAAIKIVKEYAQLPLVECYPGQLNQVFMNLIANAIDALEDSTHQQSANPQSVQSNTILISTQLKPEGQVRITIADNGVGIPEDVRTRIFNPFFTTKPIGKGTGLGLSISYQIVTEKHNGTMQCDSKCGEGTRFIIEIPLRQPNLPNT